MRFLIFRGLYGRARFLAVFNADILFETRDFGSIEAMG